MRISRTLALLSQAKLSVIDGAIIMPAASLSHHCYSAGLIIREATLALAVNPT